MSLKSTSIYLLLIFLGFFYSCNNSTEEINALPKDETIENVYPFSKAKTIEVFSYVGSYDTISAFSDYISKNFESFASVNVLNDTNLQIKDRVKLNDQQKLALFNILYKENCSDDLVGNCFNPNHAIVYYNEQGKAFAYTEISLDCMNAVSSKEIGSYKFCDAKIENITNFFKSIGVTYFGDVLLTKI